MKISYFYPKPSNPDSNDGGDIYHKKLLLALSRHTENIERIAVTRGTRKNRLPLWAESISKKDQETLLDRCRAGDTIILSHEHIFDMASICANAGRPAHLIVHNYLPRFRFLGRPGLSLAYRLGAKSFFDDAFTNAASIFFLGANDCLAANRNHSQDIAQNKFSICQIPPADLDVDYQFDKSLLHFSGSEKWLPKRLSKLKPLEVDLLRNNFTLNDYFDAKRSGFTIINDRFDMGFKLKLMQSVSMGDYVFSRVDLRGELDSICPEYRWYRNYVNIEEIIKASKDSSLLNDVTDQDREKYARIICESFTWKNHGDIIFKKMNNHELSV